MTCPLTLPVDLGPTIGLAIALIVLYWLGEVVARWYRIAHPTRELLKAQIAFIEKELSLLNVQGTEQLSSLLLAARQLVGADAPAPKIPIVDILFWSRGKEIAAWGYVHEAEAQTALFLPLETVPIRLEIVRQKLEAARDPMARTIEKVLGSGPITSDALRALLVQALSAKYEIEDTSFDELLSWQNKTAWLVAFGLLLIVALVLVEPQHSMLLLVGALGGLLSRLSRSLDRADVPTDYGASWTTLFLSPVAGALAGWGGVLLSGLGVKLQVLGAVFSGLWVCTPPTEFALAAALVFGFSERWFDAVLDQLTQATGAGSKPSRPAKSDGASPGPALAQTLPSEPPPNVPRGH